MTSHLLGIDLGAGSLKASIITRDGKLAGEAQVTLTTSIPQFGWSEQDPAQWQSALNHAVPAALKNAGLKGADIAAIGCSAGAHIPVLLDGDGRVLRPAILWNDQRAAAEAKELHERAGDLIVKTSLNRVNPTWTLAMLLWLKRHEPEVVQKTRRLMIAKDYLRFCLTQDWHSDFSDAVGALLADVKSGGWSKELAALIDWPLETLPPLAKPQAIVGQVTRRAAEATSLAEGTPVVCGSNDTTVEFFGAGAIEPGMGAIKLATAGVLFGCSQGPSVNPPISCYPHIVPGLFFTATGTNACASAHRFVRDTFFLGEGQESGEGFVQMDALAASLPPGSRGLLFHPYLQGERAPYWDPLLRASFTGLTMQHGKAEIARATYEGIAFSIRDLVEQAKSFGLTFGVVKLLGGGAKSATWRQILSDVTGLKLERPGNGDASFGAALVAGLGIGWWADARAAISQAVTTLDRNEPDPKRQGFYQELYEIYRDTQKALAPLSHRLGALTRGL